MGRLIVSRSGEDADITDIGVALTGLIIFFFIFFVNFDLKISKHLYLENDLGPARLKVPVISFFKKKLH